VSAGTVLVIDDQISSQQAIAQALAPLGFVVVTESDGEEGLRVAHDRAPDVILLDVMMPGLDGYEVCRRLKGDVETQLIPVVFLTGLDSRQARLQGLEVGAADFLAKPFDLVELEVRVRNLVQFRRLTEELDHAEEMVFAIARTIEARDAGTGEHCDRLSRLAGWLGKHLGHSDDEVKALRRAGYLHDIGKIAVPDAILLKPGPLTPDEWVVMRSHVEVGVRICSPLHSLRAVLPIIRHHHERRDGSGYPDCLAGDAIPELARVFQVIDVFDALTSDRPYRRAMASQEAVAQLRLEEQRGWWDSAVVEAFASMILSPAGGNGAATERSLAET
jgi:putative two-component system response regulator